MPQIWLTYDELAVLLDCDTETARAMAATLPLARRKSRDGYTRAKLNQPLSEAFLENVLRLRLDHDVDACVAALRDMHERMSAPPRFGLPLRTAHQP